MVSVRYEVFVSYNTFTEAIRAWKQTGKRGSLLVDVNVYGSRDNKGHVDAVFCRAGLYFQHPYRYDISVKYDNPHYLSFSNNEFPESALSSSCETLPIEAERSPQCNISEVLENLDQQDYVRQAESDFRIRTSLLKFVSFFRSLIPLCYHVLIIMSPSQPSKGRCLFHTAKRGRRCSICPITLEIQPAHIGPPLVSCTNFYL